LNLTYYVNNTGSDSNDGLTPQTPFLTIQQAISMTQLFDPNGFTVTINVADGTYAGFTAGTGALKGWGIINIIGNIATPASCLISTVTNGVQFLGASRIYHMAGFKIVNTGPLPYYGWGIIAASQATVTVANIEFGACTMYHLWTSNSTLTLQGQLDNVPNISYPFIKVSGNAGYAHMRSSEGGAMGSHCPDLVITQAITVGDWCEADFLSHQIYVGKPDGSQPNFYNSITGKANVTGRKYNATGNSIIAGSGDINYFPGTTAGITNSGGQYL
jgi:hypothetical protein